MAQNTHLCGNCGTANASAAQFCSNCGYSLTGSQAYPTVQSGSKSVPTGNISPNRRITGALIAGNTLGGRYRIVEMVGKGGFGAVYKARDERFPSKPLVAIKEMGDSQLSPKEKVNALQDFRNEADLLVQLHHPNLPNVSDVFEEDGKAYLVMEFVEGKTLATVQDEHPDPLDVRLVMGWALQLCAVLHYLHTRSQPIIFRDMKPTNIMVTADGEIKLIDFGIARVFKVAVQKDTTLLGSQGYAPLEQYGRGQSDARSDIYALGATLYDLLTKELPADAPSRHVSPGLLVPPIQLNPKISPVVDGIILKAMAEQPQDRYQSAAEIYQAIASTGLASISNALIPVSGKFSPLPSSQIPSGSTNYPAVPPPVNPSSAYTTFATSGQPQPPTGGMTNAVGQGVSAGNPLSSQSSWPAQSPPPPPPNVSPNLAPPSHTRRTFLVGGLVVAGAAIAGGTAFFLSQQSGPPVLNLNFTYSTEKQDWMQQVIGDFNNNNRMVGDKLIQVQGDARGSGDAVSRILSGDLKPAAWSPASGLELNQLINGWQKKYPGKDIVNTSSNMAPQSLVLSPLVFASWKERSDLLKAKYETIDWHAVHDALLLPDWSSLGGQPDWGKVKFGQTRPDDSNSGLLSIVLLAYSYYQNPSGLSVDMIQDAGFLNYFEDVEKNVQKFGRSSGTYMQDEVIRYGKAQYDIVTTYENLLLIPQNTSAAQRLWGQRLLPFYPSYNIVSDHPFAIFTSASQEEQQAAKTFQDFLLDLPQQRKALLSGFRPANPNVLLTDPIPGNPFTDTALTSLGFHLTGLPVQVQAPLGNVTDELIKQWRQRYDSAPSALSILTRHTQRIL